MDEPGRPSRRRVKVALLVAGAAAILGILYVWPSISLSYAKSRAMAKLSRLGSGSALYSPSSSHVRCQRASTSAGS